ncbi:hypothetical protein D3C71_1367340 [compost metagenome]
MPVMRIALAMVRPSAAKPSVVPSSMASSPLPRALLWPRLMRPCFKAVPPLKVLALVSVRVLLPCLSSPPVPVMAPAKVVSALSSPTLRLRAPSATVLPATPESAPMVRLPLAALMSKTAVLPARRTALAAASCPAPLRASVPALTVALTGVSARSSAQLPLPFLTSAPAKVVAPVTACE